MNTATIVLEVDDTGAVRAFQQINSEAGKLTPILQPVPEHFKRITASTKEAREAAALLGEEFGIKIPRALRGIAAESPIASAALRAAFSGLAVVGFIEVVKSAVDNLTGFNTQLKETAKQNDELMKSVEAANKVLLGPQNLRQVNEEFIRTQKNVEKLNQELGLTGDTLGDAIKRGVTKFSAEKTVMLEDLDKSKAKLIELAAEQAKLTDEQRRTEPIEVLKLQNSARLEGLEGIKKITQAERGEAQVVRQEMAKNIVSTAVGMAEINEIHKKAAAEREKLQRDANISGMAALLHSEAAAAHGEFQVRAELQAKLFQLDEQERQSGVNLQYARLAAEKDADAKIVALRRTATEETKKLEEEAAVAILPPWKRSYAQIAMDTQDKLRQIQQKLKDTTITSEEAAQQSAAVWQINFAKTRDQLAGDLQSLFDDVTSGNIGKRFKKMFEDMVFQMVATWILGMGQMRSASSTAMSGGAGGILGAIFGLGGGGGIFGGGGGSAPGGTPPFLGGLFGPLFGGGNASSSNGSLISAAGGLTALPLLSGGSSTDFATSIPLLGLGLSAGQGAGLPGLRLPSGAASGGAAGALGGFGGLGGLLASPGFTNLALMGGAGLLIKSLALGGGAKGALTGAAGGALIGSIIPGIGTLLGAGIGALIGLIGGLFGQHKGDKARIQVMEPLIAQIKVIRDSYDVFQTDYNTGVSELEALRAQSIASLKQIGGRQVTGNTSGTNKLVDDAESYLKTTEAERARRAQLQFGPAQFHSGGFVDPSLAGVPPWWRGIRMHVGGEVPAILEAGEHVINRSTVNRVGRGALDRMNAGGGGGDTHNHYYSINAVDAKSFADLLDRGGMEEIVRGWRRGTNRGSW